METKLAAAKFLGFDDRIGWEGFFEACESDSLRFAGFDFCADYLLRRRIF